MDKLKKYAGLLNDAAPQGEFLAFINEDEAKMLEDAGGSGLLTRFGIPSYRVGGQAGREYGGGGGSRSSGSSGGGNRSGGGGADRDGGSSAREQAAQRSKERAAQQRAAQKAAQERAARDRQREQYAAARTVTPAKRTVTVPQRDDAPYQMVGGQRVAVGDPRIEEAANVVDTRSPFEKGVESVIDFYKKGGFLGAIGRTLSPLSESIQQKAMTFGLNRKIDSLMGELDLSNPNSMNNPKLLDLQKDLADVQAGTFKQSDYTAKYGSGDVTNPLDASFNPAALSGSERQELQNLFTPELSYAISGTTPQQSMVNQYFANLGMSGQSPLSSKIETDYNTAKQSINSLLGIVPPSQQFGYSSDPYGGLMATNLATNPFNIPYLQQRGLI